MLMPTPVVYEDVRFSPCYGVPEALRSTSIVPRDFHAIFLSTVSRAVRKGEPVFLRRMADAGGLLRPLLPEGLRHQMGDR